MLEPDKAPRFLIAAGGTGGHIYPGLAIARELQARRPDTEIVFVGTPRGLEQQIIGKSGFRIEMYRAAPLRGGSLLRKIKGVLALWPALRQAKALLRRERPDAVIGIGGYLSGPLVLAAARLGIPTLILEPNFEPGLTNRWLARFVDAAAVAWEGTARHFGAKAVVTGNPVRPEIAAVPDTVSGGRFGILLFGGSQGAHALNDAMIAALPLLTDYASPATPVAELSITHQTGAGELERVRRAYVAAGVEARVEPYLEHMDREYAACNLVIARSGATTCAELAAAGRAAILVPLELAGGHQRHNADALHRAGAAIVIPQAELDGPRLAAAIDELRVDASRTIEMGARARTLARTAAAARIVDRLESLVAAP